MGSHLSPAADPTPADWVVAGVGPFGAGVGALVPRGFEAYARVLHPAESASGEPVRWSTVAEWSGRTIHPRVQFTAIARGGRGAAPWTEPPQAGCLPLVLLRDLCELLGRHTSVPQRCWFCLWTGYGLFDEPHSAAVFIAPPKSAEHSAARLHRPLPKPHGLPVLLPEREYHLFQGPLTAATEMGDRFGPQSPNLFWPDDRAWLVASEIDLDSTFVGGSASLIGELLGDPRFEALPADLADPVWITSDDINR
jgi:hypothetical protein